MAATISENSYASMDQKMLIRLIGLHDCRIHPQAQGSEDSSLLLLTLIKQIKEFQLHVFIMLYQLHSCIALKLISSQDFSQMFVKHNNYNCLIACCLKRLKKHTLVVFGTTCVLGIWGIIVNGERLKEIAGQQHENQLLSLVMQNYIFHLRLMALGSLDSSNTYFKQVKYLFQLQLEIAKWLI